ncbi:hypothetical protein RI129_008955 [Pyrocoelia pectoralis]|uniref:Uncharacterized protein n=1 Tax=Pyrocoelia pectoralis TaxID=417401 RepID=A0AAN7ZKK6_9COLE
MLWELFSILPLLLNMHLVSSSCRHENNFGVYFIYCTQLSNLEEIDTIPFNSSMIRIFIDNSNITLTRSHNLVDKRLKELQITASSISVIERDFLINFQELDRITIRDSEIQKIETFPSLIKLDSLIFQRNKMSSLPQDFVRELRRLNIMFLTNSEIDLKHLPQYMFRDVPLICLRLSGNGIMSVKPNTFATLKSLVELKLNNNSISVLPVGVFQDLEALTDLNLNDNRLISLRKDTFGGLRNLNYLTLSNNYLTHIESNWFDELPSLTVLHLNSNRIKSFELSAPLLKSLYLSQNFLTHLRDDFIDAPSLRLLDISHNSLNHVANNAFKGLRQLETLNLESNKISRLVYKHLSNLISLTLSDNKITNLTTIEFNRLQHLQSLNLSNNNIVTLPMLAFHKLFSLQELDLHNTRLTEIKPSMFAGLENLKSLNLSGNKLLKITPGTFKGVKGLKILNLGDIYVKKFNFNAFSELQHLKVLNLEYNKFTYLPVGLFANMKLNYLSLKGNAVKQLERNVFKNQTEMEELDLRHTKVENLDFVEEMHNLRFLLLENTKYGDLKIIRFINQTFRKVNEGYWDSWCSDFECKGK